MIRGKEIKYKKNIKKSKKDKRKVQCCVLQGATNSSSRETTNRERESYRSCGDVIRKVYTNVLKKKKGCDSFNNTWKGFCRGPCIKYRAVITMWFMISSSNHVVNIIIIVIIYRYIHNPSIHSRHSSLFSLFFFLSFGFVFFVNCDLSSPHHFVRSLIGCFSLLFVFVILKREEEVQPCLREIW